MRRDHHLGDLHTPPDARAHPHGVPGVLRRRGQGGPGHRRDHEARGRPRGRGARGPRAPRRALREGGGLRDEGQGPRAAAHGAHRRPRGRRRGCGVAGGVGSREDRQRPGRRRLHRGEPRGPQALLDGARPHRRHRQAHQRVQGERGRGDPARAPCRLHQRRGAPERRVLHRQQAQARGGAGGLSRGRAAGRDRRRGDHPRGPPRRPPGAGPRAAALRERALVLPAAQPRPDARRGSRRPGAPRARPPRGRRARRPDDLLAHPAARAARVVEEGDPRPPPAGLRRPRLRAADGGRAVDPRRRAARPRLHRAAHARGRRERPHQHPGQLRRLRDAAHGQRGRGAHHALRQGARRRRVGRARHRHHQARVPGEGGGRGLRGLEGEDRPGGALQPRQAAGGRGPLECLHAVLRPHRARVHHPGEERHRGDRRFREGLPALREVQARVLHPRAAREPPLQPEEQDPRPVAAHRGVPLRGADAPGREPQALRRVRRRGRPLHGLPQVRGAVPGGHRLRQRLHRDAGPAQEARPEALQPRLGPLDGLPERDRPGDHQGDEDPDARLGLQGAAVSRTRSRGASS